MWNISEEIRSAANRLMIKAEEIPTKEAEEIINKVITIYARGNIDYR